MAYIRPADLWRDGWGFPQALTTESFTPGLVSAVAKAGAGSGTVRIVGKPKDAYAAQLEVTTAGEVGGASLAVRYTLDGILWSDPVAVPLSGTLELIDLGVYAGSKTFLSAQLGNGGAAPSFVLADRYSFSTTAPPGLLSSISSASLEADEDLGNALTLPLLSWTDSLREKVAHIVTYKLLGTRGFDALGSYDRLIILRYRDAKQWLKDIGIKERQSPGLVESSPPVSSPAVLLGADRFGVMDL